MTMQDKVNKPNIPNRKPRTMVRKNKHVFALNDLEDKALERYLKKYKIENKSKFIRELLMSEVIRRLEMDSPTLFENDTNR